jgi:hypothetical protein
MPKDTTERDTSVLRARAIAAALLAARPADYLTNHKGRDAWYDSVRHVAAVVCSTNGVSLLAFYDLCGVPD